MGGGGGGEGGVELKGKLTAGEKVGRRRRKESGRVGRRRRGKRGQER